MTFAYPGGVVQSKALLGALAGDAARARERAGARGAGARLEGAARADERRKRPLSEPSRAGWRAREVERELPRAAPARQRGASSRARRLADAALAGGDQRAPARLSGRFRGARAVAIRREPVPAAYRVFFRHIGLDPDVVHTPIEAAVLERMLRGGFLSGGCSRTCC